MNYPEKRFLNTAENNYAEEVRKLYERGLLQAGEAERKAYEKDLESAKFSREEWRAGWNKPVNGRPEEPEAARPTIDQVRVALSQGKGMQNLTPLMKLIDERFEKAAEFEHRYREERETVNSLAGQLADNRSQVRHLEGLVKKSNVISLALHELLAYYTDLAISYGSEQTIPVADLVRDMAKAMGLD